jgi:superfamily II DNA or RNA helicase
LVQILVTVDVVSEGFDVPAASVAILLRPTKSLGLYLQQVGRVLRPAPGKEAALILDHVGNVTRHGFPDDHRDWTLDDGIRRTAGIAAPSVRTCPECYAAFKPQPVCPVCGTPSKLSAREIKQREGELQELARQAVQQARVRDRRQQAQARSLPELLAIAKQRGYSVGWAHKVHNARTR